MQESSRNQQAVEFAQFGIGVGYVFQTVAHDAGIHGFGGQAKVGQFPDTDIHADLTGLGSGGGAQIRTEHLTAPGTEIDQQITVTRAHFQDAQSRASTDEHIDVKGPLGDEAADGGGKTGRERGVGRCREGVPQEIPEGLDARTAPTAVEGVVAGFPRVIVANDVRPRTG